MKQRSRKVLGLASTLDRLCLIWLVVGGLFAVAGVVTTLIYPGSSPTTVLFWSQDMVALPICALSVVGLRFLQARLLGALAGVLGCGWRAPLLIAGACLVLGVVGSRLVFDDYLFSLDEFMANFDARIFAGGHLMAPLAPQWRPLAPALQPIFTVPVPGHALWVSGYLPMNAAFRALAGLAHAQDWVNPLWSAISVLMIYAVARRLWPDRPAMAVGAAALLGSSSQLIVTAMTAYAMPAHLALNLIWLWLILRGGRLGHGAAIVVAFVACGLHQIVFNPLFAAPFVLQFWLDRRWRVAALHTAAYAVIGLFWLFYWALVLKGLHVPPQSAAAVGGGWWVERVADLFKAVSWSALGTMSELLLRFMTWQNVIAVPLFILAAAAAVRAGGVLRALVAGVALTILAMAVLMPIQMHGWGYRYLHGLMGSVCLVAIWGWTRLTDNREAGEPAGRGAAAAVLAAACVVSVVVILPLRLWQAHAFIHPYAVANAAVQASPSQVVIVSSLDENMSFDMGGLVRNEPYLAQGPKVMWLETLDEDQLRDLCLTYSVRLFDGRQAKALGVRVVPVPSSALGRKKLADLAALHCDRPVS